MFKRTEKIDPETENSAISVYIDGRKVKTHTGMTVAAVLLESGEEPFRFSAVSKEPRSAYCLMGVCFECLVQIDGIKNRQACITEVSDSMRIERETDPQASSEDKRSD